MPRPLVRCPPKVMTSSTMMRMLAPEMSQVTLPNASIWPNLGSATIYWVLALILEAHSERYAGPQLL